MATLLRAIIGAFICLVTANCATGRGDEVDPGVGGGSGGKGDEIGGGWSRHHPFADTPQLKQLRSVGSELWAIKDGALVRVLANGQSQPIAVPGVDRVLRIRNIGQALVLLGEDGQVRWFDSGSWTNLPSAPVQASDVNGFDAQRLWLAGKWDLYVLTAGSWQQVSDFPGWGSIMNVGWNNVVEAAADGHIWTTSGYWSEGAFCSHFDGISWETFDGAVSTITPVAGGEALVSDSRLLYRYPSQSLLLDTYEFVDHDDGLPDETSNGITSIVTVGDAIWALTYDMLLSFDGGAWHRQPLPEIHGTYFDQLAKHEGAMYVSGFNALFKVEDGQGEWVGDPQTLTVEHLGSVVATGAGEFAMAARSSGVLFLADGEVRLEQLPEQAEVGRLAGATDGALWAVARRQVTTPDGVIHTTAILWRKAAGGWVEVRSYGWPNADIYGLDAGPDGSVYVSFGDQVKRVEPDGNETLITEDSGGQARISHFDDELWIVRRGGDPLLVKDGTISEIAEPDGVQYFGNVAAIGPGQAMAIDSYTKDLWLLTVSGAQRIQRLPGDGLLGNHGGLPWIRTESEILSFDGQSFESVVNIDPGWNLQSCATADDLIVCAGWNGLVVSHPLDQ